MTFEEYVATGIKDFVASNFDAELEKFDPAPDKICPRIEGQAFFFDHFETKRNFKAYALVLSKPAPTVAETISDIVITNLEIETRIIFVPEQTNEDGHIFRVMSRYDNALVSLMKQERFIEKVGRDCNVSLRSTEMEVLDRTLDEANRLIYCGVKYLINCEIGTPFAL